MKSYGKLKMLSLFSGIGGIDLAASLVGVETVAFVEFDPFCQLILKLRYPGVPIYGDIRQVTGKQLEQDGITRVDIVGGGFPCQGNSTAGKRKGKADERYLWPEMARIVREVESQWMVAENVRGILSVDGGELFGDVIRDVANMGYSSGWGCWGANAVGAPHQRERVFILGNSKSQRCGETRHDWQRPKEWIASTSDSSVGMMWPTPRANKISGYSSPDFSPTLEQAVLWPTPQSRDYKSGDNPGCGRQQRKLQQGWSQNLNDAVLWPTPKASLRGDCPSERKRKTPDLQSAVKLWTTPNVVDSKLGKRNGKGQQQLCHSVAREGQLNPDWVECLMNFPIGWTNPECKNPVQWPGWPAYRNQEQFDYEPPRVTTGIKNRPKRLKSLGNAVVPLQAVPIFAAIAEIEGVISHDNQARPTDQQVCRGCTVPIPAKR